MLCQLSYCSMSLRPVTGATWARSAAVLKAVWVADPANAPSAKRA
jgi:hypothetical protein